MRFIDQARITFTAGHGGPGCVSFRRETFIPRGGPDGGDGGQGGSIYLIASAQLSTLQDLRFKREYQAPNGEGGAGANKAGRDGRDIEIRIPVGTLVEDTETNEILADLTTDGERFLVCKGGRGGKGNSHFVTSTFQAPKFSQPGEPGEVKKFTLELKLLADVALVGFPNAGKSTLTSAISAAHPKIADYAFTTRVPHLGVVELEGHRSFVVADIPGLIEGAHVGLGLGHQFLKHVERTRVLIHLLDGAKLLELATQPQMTSQGEIYTHDRKKFLETATLSLLDQYKAIRKELGLFSEALLHKPEIVVINKGDVLESDPELLFALKETLRQNLFSLRGQIPATGGGSKELTEPWVISSATKQGLLVLLEEVWKKINLQSQKPIPLLPDAPHLRFQKRS